MQRTRWVVVVVVLALVATGCAVTRVSVSSSGTEGNGPSSGAAGVTDDGRYTVFTSYASNLVPGDTNGTYDTFRRDELTKATVRVSLSSTGGQLSTGGWAGGGGVSPDGRFVVFETDAAAAPADTNGFTDAYVRDLTAGTTTWASPPPAGGFPVDASPALPEISADGRFVSFILVTFTASYLYRFDRQTGVTTQLYGPDEFFRFHVSGDARHYALTAQCPTQVDCGARATLLDTGGSGAGWPALQFPVCRFDYYSAISPDGRYLFFHATEIDSRAGVCVPRGGYLVDRATGTATALHLPGNGDAIAISRGARAILFGGGGDALPGGPPAPPGSNVHLYLRDRVRGNDVREDFTVAGEVANDEVFAAALSDDGTYVAFATAATNVIANDQNGVDDVFVRETGIPPSP